MGRVAVPAIVESLEDLYRVQRNELSPDQCVALKSRRRWNTGATGCLCHVPFTAVGVVTAAPAVVTTAGFAKSQRWCGPTAS